MSFKLVAQVFDIRLGNPLRKMVLMKLADQANDEGKCWPSYESIAHACEISRRSVINHIKWLEENNYLRIEKRYNDEAKKNYTNVYHLTIVSGANNSLPPSAGDSLGSAGDSLGVVQELHHPSAGAAPEPIIEPINIEPINESIVENKKKKKSETKKTATAKKKPKRDFEQFEFSDNQKTKCVEYGINIDSLLTEFKDYHGARGNQFVDWSQAFNTWINNHIKFNKPNPIAQGNNHAFNQPANNPTNEQPKKSSTDIYAEKLAREFEQRYGQQSTTIRDVN